MPPQADMKQNLTTLKRLSILFLLALFSCHQDTTTSYQSGNAKKFTEKTGLKEENEEIFPLDTSIWIAPSTIQFLEQEDKRNLFIFNPHQLRAHIYDYDGKKEIRTVQFLPEGPDGVGLSTELMGFFAINKDTFILHNYHEQKLKVFDSNSRKLLTIDLPPSDVSHFSTIISHSPPFKEGNYVYFPNLFQGIIGDKLVKSEQIPALLKLNIRTFQFEFIGHRSEVYETGYNVAGDNSYAFATFNRNEKKVVFGFRQDHFLYEMDEVGNIEKHYAGSKFFEEIPPLDMDFNKGLERENAGDLSIGIYVRTAPKYDKIFYDNINRLYYRLTFLPRTRQEYEAGRFDFKHSILILNDQFEKIGEWVVPSSALYSIRFLMMSEQGLLIAKENEKDESQLIFGVLNPDFF